MPKDGFEKYQIVSLNFVEGSSGLRSTEPVKKLLHSSAGQHNFWSLDVSDLALCLGNGLFLF